MEVEHESFQGRQPVPGLPKAELTKKIRSGPTARSWPNSGTIFLTTTWLPYRTEEVLSFLTSLNDTCKQLTKHTRYAYLKALFNFIRNNLDTQLQNPCDTPMLRKLFRVGKLVHWQVQEKETIDEVIFRTTKVRNRLMLELMARGGMRVGEVLNLTGGDVEDQKLVIRNPKSGKETEVVFIPKKLADRLKDYIKARGIEGEQRIFPITYTAARVMVRKAGALVGIHLRAHDLRRHAATYAA